MRRVSLVNAPRRWSCDLSSYCVVSVMALAGASGRLLALSCLIATGVGCSSTPSTRPASSDEVGGTTSGAGGSSTTYLGSTGGTSAVGDGGGSSSPVNGGTVSTGGIASTGGATGGKASVGGASAVGGTNGSTGGATTTIESKPTGGTMSVGGTSSTAASVPTGGTMSAGGSSTGSGKTTGGTVSAGGSSTDSSKPTGGTMSAGGTSSTGSGKTTGGTTATNASTATGGAVTYSTCAIDVTPGTSSAMATVGTVDWSTSANVISAQIVYTLNNAGSSILNKGGTAPVDLTKSKYHTLLLGLKQSSTYTAHVEAMLSDNSTCKSSDFTVTTQSLTGAPGVTRTAIDVKAQAKGFIVTTNGGITGNGPAFIIDADGAVVWASPDAPPGCSRARMDYEGANMWMMSLNVSNSGGEMRTMSMDGVTVQKNVSGLSKAHHDFTVLKGGIVATMAWNATSTGTDPESDLFERAPDGTIRTAFHIGSNLYAGGPSAVGTGTNTYHCNSISYHPSDDSYTIGDRNPNLYVKASRSGALAWQFGGSCSGAKAAKCVEGSWQVNHGHQLLDNGNFVLFNNGPFGSTAASHVFEYSLSTSDDMSATLVEDFVPSNSYHSDALGDVQRLPNGNTLITYSSNGVILELDSSWKVVQSLSVAGGSIGYADWRETLYGAPARQ
jgi:hypothetical protein